jgi:hypothetical protein
VKTAGGTTVEPTSLAERGFPEDICAEERTDIGIYAVTEPAFAVDWSDVTVPERYSETGRLPEEATVVGIQREDVARAYPVSVLWYHEIVNDVFPDGTPLAVTFCSLCNSGMVGDRRVDGRTLQFRMSGQLWRPPSLQTRIRESNDEVFAVGRENPDPGSVKNTGNLVLLDAESGSFWSQLLATAICGPMEGKSLSIVVSTTATWGEWRRDHPDSEVLLPPPHSTLEPAAEGETPTGREQ